MMTNNQTAGHSRRRQALAVVAAALMLAASGTIMYHHFANAGAPVPSELLAGASGQQIQVNCERCGASYTIAATDYMAQVDSHDGRERLVCQRCGEAAAWRGAAPIEYTNKQWHDGYVGRDALVSDLKDYHANHPESDQK